LETTEAYEALLWAWAPLAFRAEVDQLRDSAGWYLYRFFVAATIFGIAFPSWAMFVFHDLPLLVLMSQLDVVSSEALAYL